MSSHLSRHFYTLAAAALVLSGGLGRTAWAKPCTADSDCDDGYRCSLAPVRSVSDAGISTSGTPAPAPDSPTMPSDGGLVAKTAPVDARLSIPSTGTCEAKPILCTSNADCPADFECETRVAGANPSCRADAACTTPPALTNESGTCRAVDRACTSSADCPAPLVCKSQGSRCTGGASVGPDGVVTILPETCAEGKSVCTYVPTSCTADSACADSYQCVKVSEGSSCSGSGAACTRTGGSVSCSPAEPPVCTSHVVMNCMPKQIPCGAGQACPSGWSCFDYSNFSGKVPGWTPDESGKACLPDGLVLAVQGHAAEDGSSDSGTTVGGDQGPLSTASRADAGLPGAAEVGVAGSAPEAKTPPSENSPSSVSDAGAAPQGAAIVAQKDQGCGCTLGRAPSSTSHLWLALALAGLVVRVSRRRR